MEFWSDGVMDYCGNGAMELFLVFLVRNYKYQTPF